MTVPELFQRAWKVAVAGLELSEFDVRFRVEKTLKPEPNNALVEIYNLSADQRGYLAGLVSKNGSAKKTGKTAKPAGLIPVRIEAGYVDPGPELIFSGDLITVDSERDGESWITAIGSGSGARAYRTARISTALGPGTPIAQALRTILKALGLGEGNAAKVLASIKTTGGSTIYPRGVVLTGSASRRLTDLCLSCGLEWSIQDGVVQLISRNTVLPGKAVDLSPSTGLIGSPSVDPDGKLTAKCLIIGGIRCGGVVNVNSAMVKGSYRVEKISASGDTRGQDWYFDLEGKRY